MAGAFGSSVYLNWTAAVCLPLTSRCLKPKRNMLAAGIVRVGGFTRIEIGRDLLNLGRVISARRRPSGLEPVIKRNRHQEEIVLGHL